MPYETDEEREIRQQAELTAEAVAHKAHLDSPSLVKPKSYADSIPVFSFIPPEIPATPTAQDVANVLVSLGFATQAE